MNQAHEVQFIDLTFTVSTQKDEKENTISLKTQFCCVMRRQFDCSVYVQHVEQCAHTDIFAIWRDILLLRSEQ